MWPHDVLCWFPPRCPAIVLSEGACSGAFRELLSQKRWHLSQ
jgi:hypothetical protein